MLRTAVVLTLRFCTAWIATGYLVTVIAFGLMCLIGAPDATTALASLCLNGLLALVYGPVCAVPAGFTAGVLDRYWLRRPSNLVLGLALGLIATVWTLWPPYILVGAIAGGTGGWMRDRSVALLSGRWVTVTTLGGILAGLAAMVAFRLLSWIG